MRNSELAHIWASRTRSNGKAGNMSFDEHGIYSYSEMIAAFRKDDVVFVDRYPSSHTTSNHQSLLIRAVSHFDTFVYNDIPLYTPDVEIIQAKPSVVTPLQIWEQYHQIYNKLNERSINKKYIRTIATTLTQIEQYATKLNDFRTTFNLDVPAIECVVNHSVQKIIEVNIARQNEIKLLKFDQSKHEREQWLLGNRINYPNASENNVVLRISPNDNTVVETSRGAKVPTNVCKRLYNSFVTQCMPNDTSVGDYKLHDISPTYIKIGCHTIDADELFRFAKVLGI